MEYAGLEESWQETELSANSVFVRIEMSPSPDMARLGQAGQTKHSFIVLSVSDLNHVYLKQMEDRW